MNIRKYIILIIAPLLIVSSCEEVIEIDLNSSAPALVVEAKLLKDSVAFVHLTKTANYFTLEEASHIEDAAVTLTDETGAYEELNYIGGGIYRGQSIIGTEGVNYTLKITWAEKEYTGSAFLPKQAELLSLEIIDFQPAPQAPMFKQVESVFLDNVETEDFYYLRYIVNGNVSNDRYLVFPDLITVTDTIAFTNPTDSYDPGDEVVVQVYSIDETLFNYFSQLNDALGGSMAMSSTPYNPTSNIEGAMGYFAAWSFDSDTIIVE